MVVCPACDHPMLGNPDVCTACGKSLSSPDSAGDTLVSKNDELKSPPKAQKVWQSAQVSESRTIRAHIAQAKAVVTITLHANRDVTLGRTDRANILVPDIDLTEHDALETGVSRLHAALRLEDGMVQVKDLESTNGTFLNGRRVATREWSIVRNDDELRLGHLVITLHFN